MYNEATNGDAHDFPKYEGELHTFVIASTPRSGSTFLGSLLWDSELAGRPHEYFHRSHSKDFYDRWECTNVDDYVRLLKKWRTSPNGFCGFKVHHYQLTEFGLSFQMINQLLNCPKYIFLKRQRKIRQSISLVKAEQTDQYALLVGEQLKPASYHFEAIRQQFFRLIQEENEWAELFKKFGIEPLVIYYENLAEDYEAVLQDVFGYLGIDTAGLKMPKLNLRKMSDDITEQWITRFNKDMAEIEN